MDFLIKWILKGAVIFPRGSKQTIENSGKGIAELPKKVQIHRTTTRKPPRPFKDYFPKGGLIATMFAYRKWNIKQGKPKRRWNHKKYPILWR